MIGINLGLLAGLGDALIKGDDNVIAALVEKQLEKLGQNLIQEFISQQPSTARIQRALQTGGASEFIRARDTWLNQLRYAPLPGAKILQRLTKQIQQADEQAQIQATRPEGRYWTYSRSRREWLNRDWKHDWRSQPRDWHGRWIPGRLKSPYTPRRQKRRMRALRRIARKAAREGMKF